MTEKLLDILFDPDGLLINALYNCLPATETDRAAECLVGLFCFVGNPISLIRTLIVAEIEKTSMNEWKENLNFSKKLVGSERNPKKK